MSYTQRLMPFFFASLLGVGTGIYIFKPLLDEYSIDTRGTYDPTIAKATIAGGAAGGKVQDGNHHAAATDEQTLPRASALIKHAEEHNTPHRT